MRLFFSILSIIYVACIFILAGSPLSHKLSIFNPYSLLHIPLYGILTFLLIFSFTPIKNKPINPGNPTSLSNPKTLLLPGGVASIVAIADEIYQIYVPGRDASVTDVLLDFVGIGLVLLFTFRFLKAKTINF
ncbi:MAG: VanZ family protein [Syntrophaceae bacterium]|nr:VanZ family protein [Syntrophaceae bacterium]